METRHRLGIHAGLGFHVPFGDRIRMIRDAGFEATSLWWEEKHERGRKLRHLAPEMVRRAGLHLDNIHVPYFCCNDLWSIHEATRRDAFELHLNWVRDAARHDISCVVMHATLGTRMPAPNEEGLDTFRRLVSWGEELGVSIAVENTRSNVHIAFLLDRIESLRFGLCYDSSHDHLYSGAPLTLLERYGHRLIATHFSDTNGKRDVHWLPGEGEVDYSGIGGALQALDYGGSLLLEVTDRHREETFEVFLGNAYVAAQKITEMVNPEGFEADTAQG